MGTLVTLDPPAPLLRAALASRGVVVGAADAQRAIDAEIAFYRAEHDSARDGAGLARLRRRCAAVVAATLERPPSLDLAQEALLEALRFRAYPEVPAVLAELRRRGARIAVVSNWDVSLHGVLEKTGLAGLLDGALSSAEAGAAKPDPTIFAAALELAGADAEGAVMVGDSVATDIEGALGAGLAAVLVTRAAAGIPGALAEPAVPAGVPTLPDLGGLPELVRYRR